MFHVTLHHAWLSTYSSRMLGNVRFTNGSVHDIVGAGEVRLSLSSGAAYVLRHVHYVPDMIAILISIGKLTDYGCHIFLLRAIFCDAFGFVGYCERYQEWYGLPCAHGSGTRWSSNNFIATM